MLLLFAFLYSTCIPLCYINVTVLYEITILVTSNAVLVLSKLLGLLLR